MNSIQRKLGISLAIGITLLWMIASSVSGVIISHELGEAADSSLRVTAGQLLNIAETGPEHPGVIDAGSSADTREMMDTATSSVTDGMTLEELHEFEEIKGLLGYAIRTRQGKTVYVGGQVPAELLVKSWPAGFSTSVSHRVYVEHAADGQLSILLAESLEHRRETVIEAILILCSTLPLLIPLSLALVWWIVRRSFHDLQAVQGQIESRGGNDLTPLHTEDMPRELAPIGDSVNRLLERLSRTLESERHFTTNSAHELRTPIASALAQTQRQIASLPEGNERSRARRIEQTLHDLARTSEKLMQLARAESGSMINDVSSNVYPVIEYLMGEFVSVRRGESRLQLRCTKQARFDTVLDPDGVAILLRNLIDNALKHSKPGTPVEVVIDSENNELSVINDGPVLPVDELKRLKERFRRGRSAQQPGDAEVHVVGPSGAGLGLAIAETIAGHAGITLHLYSPARRRDRGFEATLSADSAATGS